MIGVGNSLLAYLKVCMIGWSFDTIFEIEREREREEEEEEEGLY
jgi:hypothetical protein